MNDPVGLEVQEHEQDGYRYLDLGETNAGRILVLLSTLKEDSVRIISAWDAPKAYKEFYLQEKARSS